MIALTADPPEQGLSHLSSPMASAAYAAYFFSSDA